MENRRRAVNAATPGAELVTLYQVHSAKVVTVQSKWAQSDAPQADAMVTDQPNLALGILTADCTPVLFADPNARIIGAAHAGWKGALAGVLSETVSAMEDLGANRKNIIASIGPTIQQRSYEVDSAFRTRFLDESSCNERWFLAGRKEHFQFDLAGFCGFQLRSLELGTVDNLERDTYSDAKNFYSYRRATHQKEPDYGRQLSMICLLKS